MAEVLTGFRTALVTALRTQFPTAEVASGPRQGVSRDKDRINVFAPREPQGHMADRIVVAKTSMLIRYWKAHDVLPATTTPADPTELEQAKNDLETFLRTKQASLGVADLWFFQIESVTVDDDEAEWGVEARLTGFGKNVGAIA